MGRKQCGVPSGGAKASDSASGHHLPPEDGLRVRERCGGEV